MEGSRVRGVVMIIVVAVMVVGQWQSGAGAADAASSFKECYAKCFIFCMIEPTQTLCSCTTQCLKECIFPAGALIKNKNKNTNTNMITNAHAESLGFCKLGCASSLCSNISTKLNPNGQNMESCVGSCSKKCSVGYS